VVPPWGYSEAPPYPAQEGREMVRWPIGHQMGHGGPRLDRLDTGSGNRSEPLRKDRVVRINDKVLLRPM
jgi:hypothetical protein